MAGDARLFVLATLARLGEAHGHEVTREAVTDRVEQWAHVSTGALYSALRKLEQDGLIEGVRTEQVGRYPQRTVYAVTAAGHAELERARIAAWLTTGLPSDPFDLALSVSDGSDVDGLRAAISHRLDGYVKARAALEKEVEQEIGPYLEPTAAAVIRHMLMRYDTEIAWHHELLRDVESFGAPRPADPRLAQHRSRPG
jgi:DNA-binding PadR family transcriptional regulator